MLNALANNACKFHEDRLNDGMTIYFIVAKPRETVELGPVFCNGCALSVTHRTTVVQRAYGQPCGPCMESQKAKTEIYFRHCCYDSGPNSS